MSRALGLYCIDDSKPFAKKYFTVRHVAAEFLYLHLRGFYWLQKPFVLFAILVAAFVAYANIGSSRMFSKRAGPRVFWLKVRLTSDNSVQ